MTTYDDWKTSAPDTVRDKDPRARCRECGTRCHPKDAYCSACEYLHDKVGPCTER